MRESVLGKTTRCAEDEGEAAGYILVQSGGGGAKPHRARQTPRGSAPGRRLQKKKIWESESRTISILIPYGLAAIVGLVGLISLMVENVHNPLVWKITAVSGSVAAAAGVISLLVWFTQWVEDWMDACLSFRRHRILALMKQASHVHGGYL